jgi:Acetyl-CoA hydrolase
MAGKIILVRKDRFSGVSSWRQQYKLKTVTAADAAAQVKNGDRLFLCGGANYPQAFEAALAKYVHENGFHVDIFTAYLLMEHETTRPAYKNNIRFFSNFLGQERSLQEQGNLQYIPGHLGDQSRIVSSFNPRVVATGVSAPDENGWMSRSIWAHHFGKEVYQKDQCEVLVAEVNHNLPFLYSEGEAEHTYIHVSEVDYIIENDYAWPAVNRIPASKEETVIAGYIAELVDNGACLQIGLGGLADAIGTNLVHAGKKDLGVHSELLTNGIVDLIKAGVINNSRKNLHKGKTVVTCCIGDKALWDYCHLNNDVLLLEVAYVNDIRTIARIDNMISINNTMETDLLGQINSEAAGIRQYSGTGGQLEFVIGSQLSRGGKSIVALNATYRDKTGALQSKIKPVLAPGSPVTTPRTCVQYIVTEFGVANLRDKSTAARAQALIRIAHPAFREELQFAARKFGW